MAIRYPHWCLPNVQKYWKWKSRSTKTRPKITMHCENRSRSCDSNWPRPSILTKPGWVIGFRPKTRQSSILKSTRHQTLSTLVRIRLFKCSNKISFITRRWFRFTKITCGSVQYWTTRTSIMRITRLVKRSRITFWVIANGKSCRKRTLP